MRNLVPLPLVPLPPILERFSSQLPPDWDPNFLWLITWKYCYTQYHWSTICSWTNAPWLIINPNSYEKTYFIRDNCWLCQSTLFAITKPHIKNTTASSKSWPDPYIYGVYRLCTITSKIIKLFGQKTKFSVISWKPLRLNSNWKISYLLWYWGWKSKWAPSAPVWTPSHSFSLSHSCSHYKQQ